MRCHCTRRVPNKLNMGSRWPESRPPEMSGYDAGGAARMFVTKAAMDYSIDFDDAYRYAAAVKFNFEIVSFGADFDRLMRQNLVINSSEDGWTEIDYSVPDIPEIPACFWKEKKGAAARESIPPRC